MGIFLSLSYSKTFRIETINTLIHSRSSLENHIPYSRPKWTKSIPSRFQTKTPQKPNPLGRHIPIWLIYGRTPPGGIIFAGPALQRCRCSVLHWISKTWVRVRVTPPNSGCWLHLQSTVLHILFENWIRYSLSPPAGHWYQIQICISARLMSSELKTTISLFQSKIFHVFHG